MLRALFVVIIILVGLLFALQEPFYALLFYIWIAYFRPDTWLWFDFVSQLNVSLIAGILLIATAVIQGTTFRLNWRSMLLFAFLLHNALSVALSAHAAEILPSFESFVKTIIVGYLMILLLSDEGRLRTTLLMMALSLGFEATKQGWVQLLTNPGGENMNTVPFLGDNNVVAVGMLMLVPILLSLAQTAATRWERYLHRFMAIGVSYRAIATYSRGGFLAAGGLVLVLAWRSRRRVATLAGIAVVAGVVLTAMPESFWARMSTITATADDEQQVDRSAAGRLYFWAVAVDMAAAHPLAGVGHSAYNLTYDRYDSSNGDFGRQRSVHSAWFGMLAELGYPGLFLGLLNLLFAVRSCRRVRRMAIEKQCSTGLLAFATALEAGFVVYAIGGSFVPMQYNEMVWHLVALTAAMEAIAQGESDEKRDRRTSAAQSTLELQGGNRGSGSSVPVTVVRR